MRRISPFLLLAALLMASSLTNPLAGTAARYSQEASLAAVAVYATLRSMTAVLSIARDADVGVSFPVEATFSPGQTLTPLTQTVERFADVMFVVALWSGLLALLLGPAAGVGAVAAALALLALVFLRRRGGEAGAWGRPLRAVVGLGLALAVLLPSAYSLAFVLGERLTREAAAQATAVLMQVPAEAAVPAADARPGWADVRDLLAQAEAALARAGDIFQATVDLTVAYLLKLVVLPVLLALCGWRLLRALPDWSGPVADAPARRPRGGPAQPG